MKAKEMAKENQKRILWNKVEEIELRHAIENGDIRIEDAADAIIKFFREKY